MSNLSTQTGATPAPKSLLARFFGVVTSPRDTFRVVAAHPKWLGMLLLVTLTVAVLIGAFLSTRVGQDAWLDSMSSSPFSGPMTEERYARMQQFARFVGIGAFVQMLIVIPIVTVIISGLLYAIFNAAMGGDATFKQVLAVVAHASAVSVLGQLFTVPLNYARGTMSSATNLAVLLPMIDEQSFLGRLLGVIDLFLIWYVVVLAIGLAVLYRRRTQPIAATLFGVYAVIAVCIAIVRGWVGGS
jgi:hypothetical protein